MEAETVDEAAPPPQINWSTDINAAGMTSTQAQRLRSPNYAREKKGIAVETIEMSPTEYIQRAAKILEPQGFTENEIRAQRETMREGKYLDELTQAMQEGLEVAPPFLTLGVDGQTWNIEQEKWDFNQHSTQEGLHRAMAAERLGVPSIPVTVFSEASTNVEAEGAPTRPISNEWSELSGASENTLQQNLDLANAQQGVAETPMTQAQAAMGGTPLSGVIEHVGDLTNRMGPYHPLEYSYTETKAKINRALTALKSGYGFEREHNEALQGNAVTRNVPYETLVENSNTALDRYADAHAQLETYAPIQTLARDAAVALGRRQFDQATQLLEELDSKIPTQEAYVAELLGRGEPAATPVDEVEESTYVGGPATPLNRVFATMRNARQAINYIKKNTSNKLFKNLANRLAPLMGNTQVCCCD